jgi:chromosome segregation ATPase
MEINTMPEHEKIFNEICTKLNELSQVEDNKSSKDKVAQLEKMQNQIKNFQYDLLATHEGMQLKIQTLEQMTTSNSDLSGRVQELTDLLNQERNLNSKLSTDLAKSLDLSLKLQLEIQEIKSRALQAQLEDRKQYMEQFETVKYKMTKDYNDLFRMHEELSNQLKIKDAHVEELTTKINDLENGMSELGDSKLDQEETIKHLVSVAENKIVELKLALDRKSADFENAQGQLNQFKVQVDLFKSENVSLKDYINKMTVYQQQILAQQAQAYGFNSSGASPS